MVFRGAFASDRKDVWSLTALGADEVVGAIASVIGVAPFAEADFSDWKDEGALAKLFEFRYS